MKIYHSLLAAAAVTILSASMAYADVSRSDGTREEATPRGVAPRGATITLTPRMHSQSAAEESVLPTIGTRAKTPVPRSLSNAARVKSNASSKGSAFYGFRTYTGGYGDMGWMKINLPNVTSLWKRMDFIQGVGGGFVRNGDVYNFFRQTSDNVLTYAGVLVCDFNSGDVKGGIEFDVFEANAATKAVWAAVYDEINDEAYVVTSNATGNGYILQKFNPDTYEMTNLGINVPEDWLAFAWHPQEQTVYMIDESCIVKKCDMAAKRFTQVGSFNYDLTGYTCAMTYSPNDKAFLTLLDAYVSPDSYDECTDAVLLTETGKLTYLTTTTDNDQWSILYCPDVYINSEGPKAPVMTSFNIQGAATSGTLNITLPSQYENGNAISGRVYASTQIDGEPYGSSVSGNAGSQVSINISTTEGLHRIVVTPYVLSDDGYNYGTPLTINKYFGHDAPAAPKNVRLGEKSVTWEAVTTGANGGYINPASVTYDVFIDGEKITSSPVTGTSFSFTEMPKTGAVGHIAAVVAYEGGKASEQGTSGKFYTDDALSLPCFLGPDKGQIDMDEELISMFTIVRDAYTDTQYRGWQYDRQSEKSGGFYCLYSDKTTDPEKSDEWLFLPAINFDDAGSYYRLTMDVWCGNHYFSGDEVYEVTLTPAPSKRGATVIREATTVYNVPNWETSETLFQVPDAGEWYIGIHYITNPQNKKVYRLYARNFRVEKSDASTGAPAEVTNLVAEASPRGALSAVVSFNMPTVNLKGEALEAGKNITATVSTEAGSVTATGLPGAKCTVTVAAEQGENTVQVITSSEAGTGKMNETIVYCGVYRPGVVEATPVVSQDNSVLTIKVDIDDYNDKNEYVGASTCEAVIYRQIGGEWRQIANIGEEREWTFSIDPNESMELYQFGVAARNVVGFSEEMTTIGVVLGKPYTLPMNEDFRGENMTYEPLIIQHISYLPAQWGFDDPANWDPSAGNESGMALIAMWESETQVSLPKFSTTGMNNVKADLSLFFGDKSAKLITVYASSPNVTMQQVAQYTNKDGNGWEHKIINLPAACQNQGWVELVVRCQIEGYSSYFMMDSYTIGQYPEEMVTITGMHSDTRARVGEKREITVQLTNAGTSAVDVPDYQMKLTGPAGEIGTLTAVENITSIPTDKPVTLTFEYTPKEADKGAVTARFSIPDQGTPAAVTNQSKEITVYNAALPVVADLSAWYDADNATVSLNWSDPVFTETFETFEPWDYRENLRDFKNIDVDGSKVWGMEELTFNGKGLPKGYQVFSSTITDNGLLASHSGNQMLLAMSTTTGETNDWLISPEIKGGSKVSFWMNVIDAQYPETILVMYSSTDTDIESFKNVTGGYICPDEFGWKQYTVTLPADAKYFALWHYGDDGYEQFGCMIDDISYTPANPLAVKDGFNVYRDGQLIAGGISTPGYVDNFVVTDPIRYYVTTLGTLGTEKVESDRSNVIWIDETNSVIKGVENAQAQKIYSQSGMIVLTGFEAGSIANIYTIDGKEYGTARIEGSPTSVIIPSGVYVVKCGLKIAKVIVR